MKKKVTLLSKIVGLIVIIMMITILFPTGTVIRVRADSNSWSYTNGMWMGYYGWDSTRGPWVSVYYKDSDGSWKEAINTAELSAIKYHTYNGYSPLIGVCLQNDQGTHTTNLGGSSSHTWVGSAITNGYKIAGTASVPQSYGTSIYVNYEFDAMGTDAGSAQLWFKINFYWNNAGVCPDHDAQTLVEGFWYVDGTMATIGSSSQDVWTDSLCWNTESIWDITTLNTGNIIFLDYLGGDRLRNPDYWTTWGDNMPDTKQWGAFNRQLNPVDFGTFSANKHSSPIPGYNDWFGIYNKATYLERTKTYGISVDFNLVLT